MSPPNGLPRYRVLTGSDDEAFCRRVSEAIEPASGAGSLSALASAAPPPIALLSATVDQGAAGEGKSHHEHVHRRRGK
ncbi:DUF1737 domain-containing protein [Micromonospora costi]|uniref:DUF1737 domain-containing protein n=1 Tax=Micromonospora costi TaxID=1530042 RepID=UPI0033E78C1D